MGDWCGSAFADRRTDKNEITGANQDENKVALLWLKIKKKWPVFFKGEVFFYLTDPLMGDRIHKNRKNGATVFHTRGI